MKEALADYGKAADYGVAEVTTAANYEIAELYHSLSKDLFASERPKELSKDELEQYDILLEEQAFPFEEEAIELHEDERRAHRGGPLRRVGAEELGRARRAAARALRESPKSERPLSKRFAERHRSAPAPRAAASSPLALVVAACGASTPRQAAVDRPGRRRAGRRAASPLQPKAAAPQQAAAARAAAVAARRAARRRRRQRPPAAGAEPIPEAAQQRLRSRARGDARGGLAAGRARARAAHARLSRLSRAAGESRDRLLARRPPRRRARRARSRARGRTRARGREQPARHLAARERQVRRGGAAYRRALETDPSYALAHYNLGVLLDVYLRRGAEAIEHYEAYQSSLSEPEQDRGGLAHRPAPPRRRRREPLAGREGGRRMRSLRSLRYWCSARRAAPAQAPADSSAPNATPRARRSRTPDDLEPAVDVGGRRVAAIDPRRAGSARAPAPDRTARSAEHAGRRRASAGRDGSAARAAVGRARAPRRQIGPANSRVLDTLDLGTTSITGNQELPKVLYIVPWKKSDLGDLVGRPVNTLLDEVLAPVDPEVFERHLELLRDPVREERPRGVSCDGYLFHDRHVLPERRGVHVPDRSDTRAWAPRSPSSVGCTSR